MNPNPKPAAADQTKPAQSPRNKALNDILQEIDAFVQRVPMPETQMGILMLAQALTFRRILDKHGAHQRNHRMRLVRLAVEDFERKIRTYGKSAAEISAEADREPRPRM